MTKEELKSLLKEIKKEKEAKKESKKANEEKVNALLTKLTEQIVSAVKTATKEEKVVVDPNKGLTSKTEFTKEEKISEFFKALIHDNKKVVKALAEGSDDTGGYLVPEEFSAAIVDWAQDKPVFRRFATVWPMKEKVLNIPTLAADVKVYWGSENTSISTTSADFGEVQLSVSKLNAMIYMSTELFEDSEVELSSYLTSRFAGAILREEDYKFMTGDGTGEPTGLNTYSFNGSDKLSLGTADDLISQYYRLPQQFRENGVFIMDNISIEKCATLKDTNGQYLLVRPVDAKLPTLMGRPVLEQNDAGKDVYFGDLKFYYIGDRRKMSVKTTTEGAGTFEKDQVAIKVTERIDGKCALTRAFRKISNFR
jgi:HK97 family phage major capsid protein